MKDVRYKIVKETDVSVQAWSGGKTRELSIYPNDASYQDRNFIWRLSSADIEKEESDFTSLPDYNRIIMVLSGELILIYNGNRTVKLKELEQDAFDGAWDTKSFGKVTDYNLIFEKGSQGVLESILLTDTRTEATVPPEFAEQRWDQVHDCFYCHKGYAVISFDEESVALKEGWQLVLERPSETPLSVGTMGSGILIRALIGFREGMPEEEEIHEKQITKDDIKAAYLIAFSNFRGSQHLFRSLKNKWFDKPLQNGINKLEKFYIPWLIFIAGCFVAVSIAENTWGLENTGWALLIWTLLDIGIITPALFLMVLPKPIRKHIRDISTLSPRERKLYEADRDRNPRIEKVLKKYRISGKNSGDEFQGRDYKSF